MKKVRTSIEVWFHVWERALVRCYRFSRESRRMSAKQWRCVRAGHRTPTPLYRCVRRLHGEGG